MAARRGHNRQLIKVSGQTGWVLLLGLPPAPSSFQEHENNLIWFNMHPVAMPVHPLPSSRVQGCICATWPSDHCSLGQGWASNLENCFPGLDSDLCFGEKTADRVRLQPLLATSDWQAEGCSQPVGGQRQSGGEAGQQGQACGN